MAYLKSSQRSIKPTPIQHDDLGCGSMVERRGFLTRTATVVGGTLVGASVMWGASEQATAQAPVSVGSQMKLVQRHENDHVAALVAALGPSARPKPTFQNLTQRTWLNSCPYRAHLENTGVGAYLGATPAIFDPSYLAAAGSIALVEARHAGLFNSLTSRAMTENVYGEERSFERALTVEEVVMLAGPFIV